MPQPNRYLEVQGILRYSTDKALQISFEDGDGVPSMAWFPKSQIHNIDEINERDRTNEQTFMIAEWLCKDKGII